jgi:hypothetical protein
VPGSYASFHAKVSQVEEYMNTYAENLILLMNRDNNNRATMIGAVAGPGSFIVALLGAVFRLFKHCQKKNPKNSCQQLLLKDALQIPSQLESHSQPFEPPQP